MGLVALAPISDGEEVVFNYRWGGSCSSTWLCLLLGLWVLEVEGRPSVCCARTRVRARAWGAALAPRCAPPAPAAARHPARAAAAPPHSPLPLNPPSPAPRPPNPNPGRLSPGLGRPPWYVALDEEEEDRRWA